MTTPLSAFVNSLNPTPKSDGYNMRLLETSALDQNNYPISVGGYNDALLNTNINADTFNASTIGSDGINTEAFQLSTLGEDVPTPLSDSIALGTNITNSTSTPWYKDKGMIGAGAGLASALTSLIALPSQIDLAKTQTDALKQNIKFARQEQNRRNDNVSSFNGHNRSAFAGR